MIDLGKLEKEIDQLLAQETSSSLTKWLINKRKESVMEKLTEDNVYEGLNVLDMDGHIGVVMNCKDPHNIDIIYPCKNGGFLLKRGWFNYIHCCGSQIYCGVKSCKENDIDGCVYVLDIWGLSRKEISWFNRFRQIREFITIERS